MNVLKGAAVVGQSGGPTAAINATLSGVIRGALDEGSKGVISKLYGMRNGIEGLLKENLVDLGGMFSSDGEEDDEKLRILAQTPAAALGSCRKKLPDPSEDPDFYESLISVFKKYDIRYFFYIGGNDSMDTVAKLSKYLAGSEYEMRCVGIPKTIDNDLAGTDHTPGFGSAAKYIATTVQEIVRDCAVYSVPAVTVVEIMGRDAGWLTASAALANLINGEGPDLVYLPERSFSFDLFLEDLKIAQSKKPGIVVAVSEGLRLDNGRYVGEGTQSGATDVFGHKYLAGTAKALEMFVKEKIGCKVRSIELNLPQRCAAHLASLTDINESIETGLFAVRAGIEGSTGVMVSSVRGGGDCYSISFRTEEISGIANAIRCVPDGYINERGNGVTDECLRYIFPLIQGECRTVYRDGLPVHIVI